MLSKNHTNIASVIALMSLASALLIFISGKGNMSIAYFNLATAVGLATLVFLKGQ